MSSTRSKDKNVARKPQKPADTGKSKDSSSSSSSTASLDISACSLCHCTLDFSDRAAFFTADRQEDYDEKETGSQGSFYFRRDDPYLPVELYDPTNALVYCDTCDRLYHQQCHFVPIIYVPRGRWQCLFCQSRNHKECTTIPDEQRELMFVSPPNPAAARAEKRWELEAATLKASVLQRSLKQLRPRLTTWISQIRNVRSSIDAWTSTQRHKGSFRADHQQLRQWTWQAVWKRVQVHNTVLAVHRSIQGRSMHVLHEFCRQAPSDFVQRVIFPFGTGHAVRPIPRTAEQQGGDAASESSLSLDHLACATCLDGTASDENDLVLCDGLGCGRAFHSLKCTGCTITIDEDDADEDWFCPLCQSLSDILWFVQKEYNGDEWERRRQIENKSDSDSLASWENVSEVFPHAVEDFPTALLLQKGVKNASTNDLVERVVGKDLDPLDDEDEDEDDAHFDLEAYQKVREQKKNEDASTHSSNATLVDLSSVELEIDSAELAALSEDDSDGESGEEDSDDKSEKDGWTRRLRRTSNQSNPTDMGRLDKANIVKGKRGRAPVDYVLLNEAIFGDLSVSQRGKLDDTDEFRTTVRTLEEARSTSSGSSSSSRSCEEEEEEGSSNTGDDETPSAAASKKKSQVSGSSSKRVRRSSPRRSSQ